MLLPFDVRADCEGWTVIEVESDRTAVLDELPLVGLSSEDAETLTNALNRVAVERARVARVFDVQREPVARSR